MKAMKVNPLPRYNLEKLRINFPVNVGNDRAPASWEYGDTYYSMIAGYMIFCKELANMQRRAVEAVINLRETSCPGSKALHAFDLTYSGNLPRREMKKSGCELFLNAVMYWFNAALST